MRVLRSGMHGDDVERWQFFLVGQEHQLEVDSKFGDETFKATEAFQSENHIGVEGAVGHDTLGRAMLLGFDPLDDAENTDLAGPNWPPKPNFSPLVSNAQRQEIFGKYDYVSAPLPNNPEHIRILGTWAQDNIATVQVPQLIGVQGAPHDGRIEFNRKGADQLVAIWKAWQDAGLIDRVLTWDGSFAPRFVRGSKTQLSNHAFGTAFDIDYQWNLRGTQPALLGKKGCVRELVSIANDHGFYWGGHFGTKPDGMHFEVARLQ